jgi:hypothetical protein
LKMRQPTLDLIRKARQCFPGLESLVLYCGTTNTAIISMYDVVRDVQFPALKDLELWRLRPVVFTSSSFLREKSLEESLWISMIWSHSKDINLRLHVYGSCLAARTRTRYKHFADGQGSLNSCVAKYPNLMNDMCLAIVGAAHNHRTFVASTRLER